MNLIFKKNFNLGKKIKFCVCYFKALTTLIIFLFKTFRNYINRVSSLRFYFLSYLLIIITALLVLYPSFNLAFGDDDWYTILLYNTGNGLGLFTPYGVQYWFFGSLYSLFGPNYYIYFIFAFILRSLTALSLLFFIHTLTNNRILAILGGVMFSVGFAGIQTTFEPVNMNVYLSIIGYMIFLTFFYLTRDRFSIKYLIFMGGSLFFATLISPVRTYPIYVWAFVVDIHWLLFKSFTKNTSKKLFVRQVIIILLFLFLNQVGTFAWNASEKISLQSSYLTKVGDYTLQNINALINFDMTYVFNFLTGIGSVILPNKEKLPPSIHTLIGGIYILTMMAILFVRRIGKCNLPLLDFLLWVPIFYIGYSIIITTDSARMPLIYSPSRYFLPVYAGFVINLIFIFKFVLEKKSTIFTIPVLFVTVLLVIVNSITLNIYLQELIKTRDGVFNKKVWRKIQNDVPRLNLSSGKPSIFYFETDDSNRALYTITGSGRQYIILYGIPQLSGFQITPYNPMVFHTFEGLMLVLTGQFQGADAKINPLEPPPWDRIYAFRLEGDQLIDIKDSVRKKIEKALFERQPKINNQL